jgi:hypothetical protein
VGREIGDFFERRGGQVREGSRERETERETERDRERGGQREGDRERRLEIQ